MAASLPSSRAESVTGAFQFKGMFWLACAVLAAGFYFRYGLAALLAAWETPEYSHGPLIPVLSSFLLLRQLKGVPVGGNEALDRRPGLILIAFALLLGGVGRAIQISDFTAYAIILWIAGMLLLNFGWKTGRKLWPPVVHLIFMLPLPAVLYYGLSTYLQGLSSELGVFFLQALRVPVFLDGNIIDLGVYKLQVAEACSGLRYLFPILSFSYIFSVLYRGPFWHKAVLLLSAAPITVLMNSIRIAIAGVVVDRYGTAFVEGLTHFLEGWVIFVTCVLILFALARLMLLLHPERPSLAAALDLEIEGLGTQLARLRLTEPSRALAGVAIVMIVLAGLGQTLPQRQVAEVQREPFYTFPTALGDWTRGPFERLDGDVARVLRADDYLAVPLTNPDIAAPVDLFVAWYRDQTAGGTHSPTVCLPAAGWEIAGLTRISVPGNDGIAGFDVNRAIIQKGVDRMLVYYWFDQRGERTASAFYAKLVLTWGKITTGHSDGALVRLITPIGPSETEAVAEARLRDALYNVAGTLPRYLPAD